MKPSAFGATHAFVFGARTPGWACLVAALLGVLSCRAHREVCEGASCSAQGGTGGTAVAVAPPPEPSAGVGGTAGESGAAEPECARDRDCADDSFCDGREVCESGVCKEGPAVRCAHGTSCIETGEQCLYAKPSPWLVVTTLDRVLGLPTAELGRRELITLAERPREQLFQGFAGLHWTGDGKVALLTSMELEFGSRVEMLRFGEGLPSLLLPVPNLPSWGYYEPPEVSRDSTRALFVDNDSGAYLVSLSGAEETRRVADADAMERGSFCADSNIWLATLSDGRETLVELEGEELSVRDLGLGYATLAPHARLLLMKLIDDSEETLGLNLVGCDDTDLVVPLPGAKDATFSSDSKLLLVQLLDGGLQVLSLDDPENPFEIWSDAAATLRHGFFDRDSKLLIDYVAGDEGEVISTHVVDLTAAKGALPTRVSLPATASIEVALASGLLAWSIHSEPRSLLWVPLVAGATPLEIFVDPTFTTSQLYSVPADPTGMLVARRNGDDTDLIWLTFDSESYEQSFVATFNGASIEAIRSTQDGSGLLVQAQATATDNRLYWIPWREGGAVEPMLLSDRALAAEVQPWP